MFYILWLRFYRNWIVWSFSWLIIFICTEADKCILPLYFHIDSDVAATFLLLCLFVPEVTYSHLWLPHFHASSSGFLMFSCFVAGDWEGVPKIFGASLKVDGRKNQLSWCGFSFLPLLYPVSFFLWRECFSKTIEIKFAMATLFSVYQAFEENSNVKMKKNKNYKRIIRKSDLLDENLYSQFNNS